MPAADSPQSLNLDGLHFVQLGLLDKAIACFQKAVTLDPNYIEALYNLGLAYVDKQQPEQAIAIWQEVVTISPDHIDTWWNLGTLFAQHHQIQEAISCYQQVLEYQPDSEAIYICLGGLFALAEDWQTAIECYEVAIALNSENLDNYFQLGRIFHKSGEPEAATGCYQRAIEVSPAIALPYMMFGNYLFEQGKIEAGLEQYQIAFQTEPNSATVLINYSTVLISLERFDGVIDYCETAIKLDPSLAAAYDNYATVLQAHAHFQDAQQYYAKALELSPNPELRLKSALLSLLAGDYENGLVAYESRWLTQGIVSRSFQQPWWDGSDLTSQTILVWAEQAYGDVIQFARYLPFVLQKGAKVIFQCPIPLMRLIGTLDENVQILAGDAPVPEFDLHIPLMSLPRIFKTKVDTIPDRIPYLVRNVAELDKWEAEQKLNHADYPDFPETDLNIGIVWASGYFGDRLQQLGMYLRKSCPLSLFISLLQLPKAVPKIHLYSLQVGHHAKDIAAYKNEPNLHDLTPFIHDFADTAVFVSKLDLIISVDTATAHLAGAMGKPVWILLPLSPDWRWLTEREDSPWYPTARLFRQKQQGNWTEVFVRLKQALSDLYRFRFSYPDLI